MAKRLIAAIFLAVLIAGAAAADYNLSFNLSNESGWTFKNVYLTPTQNLEWDRSTDRVRMSPLKSGYHVKISEYFKSASKARRNCKYWNLRVEYGKGQIKVWSELDLTDMLKIEIDRNWVAHFIRVSDVI